MIQLELPLRSPPGETARSRQGDWRLDDRTRHIGRQGVAAARALLGTSATTGHGERSDGDRGGAGRAA
jgi:hypothetical protein